MTSCARIYTPISFHLKSTTSRTLLPSTPPHAPYSALLHLMHLTPPYSPSCNLLPLLLLMHLTSPLLSLMHITLPTPPHAPYPPTLPHATYPPYSPSCTLLLLLPLMHLTPPNPPLLLLKKKDRTVPYILLVSTRLRREIPTIAQR